MNRQPCNLRAAALWRAIRRGKIEPGNGAVYHRPAALDHHPVGAVRAAQHQRCQRIAVPGKTQLVELEQCQIGALADGDLAQFGTADAGRRPLVAQRSASLWLTA